MKKKPVISESEQMMNDASDLPGINLAGIELTGPEFLMLQQLVGSPAYTLLQRMLARVGAQTMGMLESQDEIKEVYRLQGQVKAYRWLQNFPGLLVRTHKERMLKKSARPASP